MYTVQYSDDIQLMDITFSGLVTSDDIRKYADECRTYWNQMGIRAGYKLRIVLNDAPLPQDALAVLAKAFTSFPTAARTAMVTQSAITRMQIKRAMSQPQLQIFDTPEAALAWLTTP